MISKRIYLLVFFLAICGPVPLCAQEPEMIPNPPVEQEATDDNELLNMSIEDLMDIEIDTVYSASKYEQKISEAPSSVTVITADEIRKYGYRTLADVLRSVRGFYVTYDRNYHYLGVRGFGRPGDYNNRILMLVDGYRVNENIGGGAGIGTDFYVDVDLIERVEIIRGPGSSLYGTNAFFAVINVITKNGARYDGLELSGEVASFDTQKGRISFGKRFDDGLDVLFSATIFDSEGQTLHFKEFNDPTMNNGYVNNDDDQFYSFFGKISWQDFTFEAASVAREKGIPTAPWGTEFNDSRTRSYDDVTLLGLTWQHAFSDKLSVMGRVSYNHYNYDGRWVYDYAEEGDEDPYLVVNKDYWKGRWWVGEWQLIVEPIERHKLTVGTEYRYNVRQDQVNWDEEVYLYDHRHSKNWGVYAQDEYRILENVILNAGVRYDQYDTFGGTTNPRFGLIYNPFEQTTLKLLYGKAFRAPSAYELYYHDGGYSAKANPDLDPEKITTYEFILEQNLGAHFNASLSNFYYNVEDLIDQKMDPADDMLVFSNLDNVKAHGLELGLEGKHDSGLRGRVSYTFVDTETEDNGQSLVNSPQHMAKLNLIVPLVKDKLFAGLETQFCGERKTLSGHHADDFFLTNVTLFSMNIMEGMELSASVYNIFDQEFAYPGFGEHLQDTIEQDGRSFRMKLTYRF